MVASWKSVWGCNGHPTKLFVWILSYLAIIDGIFCRNRNMAQSPSTSQPLCFCWDRMRRISLVQVHRLTTGRLPGLNTEKLFSSESYFEATNFLNQTNNTEIGLRESSYHRADNLQGQVEMLPLLIKLQRTTVRPLRPRSNLQVYLPETKLHLLSSMA